MLRHRLLDSGRLHRIAYPGGLTLLVHPQRGAPVAAVRCYVRGGSIAEWPRGGAGTAHLLEHVVATAAAREMERRGDAALLNAFTGCEHTCFRWSVLARDCIGSLRHFCAALPDAAAIAALLDGERRVVEEEIRLFAEDRVRLFRQGFLEELFDVHPVRHPVCGYGHEVRAATAEALADYAARLYRGGNLHLVVAGDVEVEALAAAVGELAGGLGSGPRFELPPEAREPRAFDRRAFEVAAPGVADAYTQVGLANPAEGTEVEALAALAEEINGAREGGLRRRLLAAGVEDDLVAQAVDTAFGAGHFTILVRHAAAGGERPAEVGELVLGWLEEVAAGREELLETWRKPAAKTAFTLDGRAGVLGHGEVRRGDPLEVAHREERLRRLTSEEVAAELARRLASGRLVVGRLAPRAGRRRASARPRPEAAVTATLVNGVRLAVLPTASPVAACQVLGRGGVLADRAGEGGLSSLMARLLPASLAPHLEKEHSTFDELEPDAFFAFCDPTFFGLSVTAAPERLDRGLELLAEMALRPVFAADRFELERRRTVEWLTRLHPSWQQGALRRLRRAMYPRHPYGREEIGTCRSLARLEPADVAACHERLAVGPNLVVVVAGRVEAEATLERLAGLFAGAPPTAPPGSTGAGEPPDAADDRLTPAPPTSYSTLALGFSGLAFDLDRWCALEVAKTLLAGPESNSVTGRLIRGLRERGIAYGATCVHEEGFDEGFFALAAAFDPAREAEVAELVEAEVARLAAGEVTEARLEHARKLYLLQHALAHEAPRTQAYEAARLAFLAGEPDAWQRTADRVEGLRRDELTEVAARSFSAARRSLVVQRPSAAAPATRREPAAVAVQGGGR